jgi:PLD-like domain
LPIALGERGSCCRSSPGAASSLMPASVPWRHGQTDPTELLYFINHGVEVHSVENLHAKVFVFGDVAVVGSMNVSRRSAVVLQEAAVLTTNRSASAASRRFVESQLGEEITAAHARRLKKLYKPPQLGTELGSSKGSRSTKAAVPRHKPLWIFPLTTRDWNEDESREAKSGRPAAARRIHAGKEKLDEFAFSGTVCEQLKMRHLVLMVVREGRGVYAYQAAHVVGIRRFRRAKGAPGMVVFLATRLHSHRKRITAVRSAIGAHRRVLPKGGDARLVRDPAAAHALLSLWARRATVSRRK